MAEYQNPDWLLKAVSAVQDAGLSPEITYCAQTLIAVVAFIEGVTEQTGQPPDTEWLEKTLLTEFGVAVEIAGD